MPNVDEQPKIAINQMKILNLLVELRDEAEQCNIANVVGREQLLDFIQWRKQVAVDDLTDKEIVKFYLARKVK